MPLVFYSSSDLDTQHFFDEIEAVAQVQASMKPKQGTRYHMVGGEVLEIDDLATLDKDQWLNDKVYFYTSV